LKPSLIIHGGAWDIPAEAVPACRNGIVRSLEAAWTILSGGGSAEDAVEAAIATLEDDPAFDAGIGSHLNLDGVVQLDAILMDGATLKAGAVATVERVRNPIRLARCVLEKSPHMMLVGAGAEKFAEENGIALCANEDLIAPRARLAWAECRKSGHSPVNHAKQPQGTVGAVAIDSEGRIFAGTSTGGTCCKYPGRVGDSPLIGCGCYADAEAGGASCTGLGEGIMRIVMAKSAVDLLRGDSFQDDGRAVQKRTAAASQAQAVAEASVWMLAKRGKATGGLILLDRDGHPGVAFNTPNMAYGLVEPGGQFRIFP
jgi:L-asparaginase / beta-aspartyl-peptidase